MNILRFFKGSSLLNVVGMTVAFASLYILLVQVNYDLGYNKNIKDVERIYVMAGPSWYTQGKYQLYWNRQVPKAMCESASMVESWGMAKIGALNSSRVILGEGAEEKEFWLGVCQMTKSALDVFGFEAIQGSFDGMDKEHKVAISDKAAKFMNVGIGDVVRLEGYSDPKTICAIYPAQSKNSDLGDIELIFSKDYETLGFNDFAQWSYHHFIKLHSPLDKEAFEEYAEEFVKRNYERHPHLTKITLLPVKDMYYNKQIEEAAGRSGNKTTTLTLLVIAVLIIVITLVNYVNFFMAQVPSRIRSVNTRKILGSSRGAIIGGFMLESGVLVIISFFLAAAVVVLFKSSAYAPPL